MPKQSKDDEAELTLREAREQGRLAEFIEQHSKELAEDQEFQKVLERMERDEKLRKSGYKE
ncbi:MAG: hypothetical protein KF911_06205 [Pseudomonadales bacterium]|nr:hypothetical protein [Pseudomonadales bacterium]